MVYLNENMQINVFIKSSIYLYFKRIFLIDISRFCIIIISGLPSSAVERQPFKLVVEVSIPSVGSFVIFYVYFIT